MSSKKKLLIFAIFIFYFLFPPYINAAFSFNITSPSITTITSGGQEIDVSLNIVDLPSESYFRVSLQKESGGSYYGYILNNSNEWSKILTLSSDCSGYYKITDLTTTLLNIKYKIGDDLEISNGNYNLKAHRFTKTCTSYIESTNLIPIVVNLPTPTPSPTPAPTQEPTSAPTSTPTATPTPKPTPTKTPTIKPTATVTAKPTETSTSESDNIVVPVLVGLSGGSSTPEGAVLGKSTKDKSPFLPIFFVSSGVFFMTFGVVSLYKKTKTEYNNKNEIH